MRWRLQTHLMEVKAPNYTHLNPYLGEPTQGKDPARHLRLWHVACGASSCSSTPVSRGCKVVDRAPPEPDANFHSLAGFTCFGLRWHLYMHSHRFYPAGSKNLSHLTQPLQQLLINNRRATFPPRGEAEDSPFLQATYGIPFFQHKLCSAFKECYCVKIAIMLELVQFFFFFEISTVATLRDVQLKRKSHLQQMFHLFLRGKQKNNFDICFCK